VAWNLNFQFSQVRTQAKTTFRIWLAWRHNNQANYENSCDLLLERISLETNVLTLIQLFKSFALVSGRRVLQSLRPVR
jgi:hypothetical protein